MVTKDLGMVTAYAYAVAGGYTGTEAEFTQLMADLAVVVDDFDNFSVNVTTLPAGSSATASYADGVLSLGIPKGDKGDKGDTGETGAPAGFGTVSATVDDNIGTPSVEVTASGADTAKNFAFAFHNLKGQKGDKGDTGEVSEAELAETLEAYAKIDGYYSNLTAGSAEQLLSTVTIEDEVPYQFRTSGGSADIGDRETDMLVGGTVAWNQLVQSKATGSQNDVTFTNNNDGTYTINGTASADAYFVLTGALITGHKYLISNKGATNANLIQIGFPATATTTAKVISAVSTNVVGFQVRNGSTASSEKVTPQCFDLTQMFGSTVADYIYSLEQANAGAGVAWFKKLFPKPYYAYNAGELMSVKALRHKTVGFNQFDKSTATDGKFVNGNKVEITDASKGHSDLIPVVPSTNYYCTGYAGTSYYAVLWLDAEKNPITDYSGASKNAPFLAKSPSNAYYAILNYNIGQKDTVCFNISWDGERDGEYEEYSEHIYELDPDLELRGIPKLSAGNDLYYDGDVYESDGTVTRRYGIVDLGTLDWDTSVENIFYANASSLGYLKRANGVAICSKYVYGGSTNSSSGAVDDKKLYLNMSSGSCWVFIHDSAYTDAATFKTTMSGVYLVYELTTPTTESAEPYTSPQIVNDFGTEEYVTTSIVPVGHKTQYMPNLRAKLEMAPNSPGGDGDYIVRQTNGANEYVAFANNATIQNILARLEALEG